MIGGDRCKIYTCLGPLKIAFECNVMNHILNFYVFFIILEKKNLGLDKNEWKEAIIDKKKE